MPQFSTTEIIFDVFYFGVTGVREVDLTYEFEIDGVTKAITPTVYELADFFYAISFTCDTQTDNLTLRISANGYYHMAEYIIGSETYSEFQSMQKNFSRVHLDLSGIVIGDVTLALYKNKATSAESITFVEDADNYYKIDFTPVDDDFWFWTLSYKAYRIVGKVAAFAAPAGGGTTINVQASTTNQVSASSSNYTIVRASS